MNIVQARVLTVEIEVIECSLLSTSSVIMCWSSSLFECLCLLNPHDISME